MSKMQDQFDERWERQQKLDPAMMDAVKKRWPSMNEQMQEVIAEFTTAKLTHYKAVVDAARKYHQVGDGAETVLHRTLCNVVVFDPDPVKCTCGLVELKKALKEAAND